MKFKKKIAVLIATMMTIGALSGCNNKSTSSDNNNQEEKVTDVQKEENTAKTGTENNDITTLKWYTLGFASRISVDSLNEVKAEINRQLESDNLKLDLLLIEPGDYDQKMQMVMASNEEYDLAFTSSWMNSFTGAANKGAYAPLEDIIKVEGTNILDEIPEYAWKALTINSHLYAIPDRQSWGRVDGYYVRKDLADKYNFAPDINKVTPLEDLEVFFQSVKDGETDVYGTYIDGNYKWGYNITTNGFDELTGRNVPGVVRFTDDTYTVVNQFATEEFETFAKRMKSWNDKGFIRKDSATYALSQDAISKDLKTGKIATEQLGTVAPHVYYMAKNSFDNQYDVLPLITSNKYITTSSIQGSCTAVGVNSKNPDKAVKLMNKIYSDDLFFNTFLYGIEGKNYEKTSPNQVKLIEGSGYGTGKGAALLDWALGDQFKGWTLDGTDADIWSKNIEWQSDAVPSKTIGFTFNSDNVKTELANVSAVISSDLRLLDSGSVEVETFLPEFIKKLKNAGSDKIVEECQKQLNEWLEQNK